MPSENFVEVTPETVGQFTGIQDKNEKEIYEGDKLEFCTFDHNDHDTHFTGVVMFSEGVKKKVFSERDRGHMGDHKVGLHLFTKNSFLDDSHHERTYWMYANTWPGFQFGNLAAKTGQMLVVGPKKTYGVQAYTKKDGHSPWFIPGDKGFLLFADKNDNAPVLDHRARNLDKGIGFTRAKPPEWFAWVPVRVNAMVLAGDTLFIAGPPELYDETNP